MMGMMRPVIGFLNKLKAEKEAKADDREKGPLESMLDEAQPTPVSTARTTAVFIPPTPKEKLTVPGPKMQKIQYDAPLAKVLAVKKAMKAHSYKEVGEKTFDYFYNAEIDE